METPSESSTAVDEGFSASSSWLTRLWPLGSVKLAIRSRRTEMK